MTPLDKTAFVVGTWFGCGRAPKAPGTVGSVGAVPLHLLLMRLPLAYHVGAIVAITVVGTWAAQRVSDNLREKDPQRVVVDEVAGTLIAMAFVRDDGFVAGALALVLFRVFDITKPGPIRRAEHAKPPGLGIMLDDLLAGLVAGVLCLVAVLAFSARPR